MKQRRKSLAKVLSCTLKFFWLIGWIILIPASGVTISGMFRGVANTLANALFLCFVSGLQLIVFQLRKILDTVLEERPFTLANVARIRSIGHVSLALGVIILAKDLYIKGWKTFIILNVDGQGVVTNVQLALPFLIGILALILSDIFRLGYQLYEENSLTI